MSTVNRLRRMVAALPVEVRSGQLRFLGARHLTFLGLRWSRTYGLTTELRWQDGSWLGATSWRQVAAVGPVRLMRCKYGRQPGWLARRRWLSGLLELISLPLPTAAGRHRRMMIRDNPDIERDRHSRLGWWLLERLYGRRSADAA